VPEPSTSAAERPARAIAFRKLALVGSVIVLLASAGAWVAYRRLIHYERRAALHLPAGTDFAGRVDVERIVLFEPVRRYLLPLINELPLPAGQPGGSHALGAPDRLTRLREAAGLNLGLDLREIAFASAGGTGAWALVFGGLFPDRGLVPAIERVLRDEGSPALRRQGDVLVFQPWGAALSQAADGVLILADTPETLASALSESTRLDDLGLPREGAAGMAVSMTRLLDALRGAAQGPSPDWVGGVQRLVATASIGQDLQVQVSAQIAPSQSPASVAAAFEGWRQSLPAIAGSANSSADWAEEWGLLARARPLPPADNNVVIFDTYWHRPELDRAARNLASWLERRVSPLDHTRGHTSSPAAAAPLGN
jgi:hypothetical protein